MYSWNCALDKWLGYSVGVQRLLHGKSSCLFTIGHGKIGHPACVLADQSASSYLSLVEYVHKSKNSHTSKRASHRYIISVRPKAANSLSLLEARDFESIFTQSLQR
jgi:hypothetical protein